MISFGTTAITALSPWLLATVPVAGGLLFYIYRKRGSSTHRVVSSLFLMRNLPRATPGRRRFVPPLQFWIELLLFTLLACAAASLILNEQGKRIAVVIDNSLSMSAVDQAGTSRLERAKSFASADIAQTLPPTRFTIFTANSSLDSVSTRGVSMPVALATIRATPQEFSADKISTHLEGLLSQGAFDAVWVYTDHPLQDGVVPTHTRVVTIPSEAADRVNTWLSSLSVRDREGESAISMRVESSSKTSLPVSVGATCSGTSSSFELPPVSISLEFQTPQTVQLPLASQQWSYCHISITLPPGTFDGLRHDNEGWIANNPTKNEIKVVSPLSPDELGLSQIKTRTFSREGNTSSSPTIYHRVATVQSNPTSASLIVFPPSGALLQGGYVRPEVAPTTTEITRWDSSHPILTYVNPSLLKVPVARSLTCPEASTPLLFSQAGTLACAGETNGVRYAVVGFELFPFDGKKNPTLSILTLNLLSWISHQTGITTQGISPGSIPLPPGTTAARYVAPADEPLSLAEGRATVYASQPGVVELRRDDAAQLIALQLPTDTESALTQLSALELPTVDSEPKAKRESESTDLTPWLALLALVALVADLLRRIVRKQRWVAS